MFNPPLSRVSGIQQLQSGVATKVIGVGGAGCNAIDRLILDGVSNVSSIVCNTDVQALAASLAERKIQLGRQVTRGLGAGGDPELGLSAADEATDEIRAVLGSGSLVIVCTGLGGGTGSGATPLIVRTAREQNSLVLVCVTLPFSFEGRRRSQQAQEALATIQRYADAVMCFENDRMGELIQPDAGIHEAFASADHVISQSVRAIIDLTTTRGLIHIGFDDLLSALRNQDSRCLFGYGEGKDSGRAKAALLQAFKSPFMNEGTLLKQASNVLVNITGGHDLTLSEAQIVMDDISAHVGDQTQILFGVSISNQMDYQIGVTILSSLGNRLDSEHLSSDAAHHVIVTDDAHFQRSRQTTEAVFRATIDNSPPLEKNATVAVSRSEHHDLSIRGKFDQNEVNVVDGEDLDVPTFMRRGTKLK